MEIKVIDPQGKEVPVETIANPNPADTIPVKLGDLEIDSIGKMFDLTPSEINTFREKLGILLDYAKTVVEEPSLENLKWAIRNLEYKVGTPPLGEKVINYLSTFAYLHLEGLRIEKEKEKYIKNSLK